MSDAEKTSKLLEHVCAQRPVTLEAKVPTMEDVRAVMPMTTTVSSKDSCLEVRLLVCLYSLSLQFVKVQQKPIMTLL